MISQRPTIAPGPRLVGVTSALPVSTGDGVPDANELAGVGVIDICVDAVPRLEPDALECVDASAPSLPRAIRPSTSSTNPMPAAAPPPAISGIGLPPTVGGTATTSLPPGVESSSFSFVVAPA